MSKKLLTLLFLAAICSSNLSAQELPSEKIPDGRKVPIVTYTPHYFYGQVVDAFRNPEQDCYIFTKDSLYAYRYPNYIPNSNQYRPRVWTRCSWTDLQNEGGYDSRRMPLFKEIVQKNDSCFMLILGSGIIQGAEMLGILENGAMRIVSEKGEEYASIGDAITDLSHNDILSFTKKYQEEIKIALYSDWDGNWLYALHSEEEAAQILKEDFYYQYSLHKQDTLANIQCFVDYFKKVYPLWNSQEAILKARILRNLRNNAPDPELSPYNISFYCYCHGDYKIRVMGQEMDSLLKGIVPQTEYESLMSKLHFKRERLLAALSYFLSKYPEIIDMRDPNKAFYRDHERIFEYLASKGAL